MFQMHGQRLQLEATETEAGLLRDLLATADEHPIKCHCCVDQRTPMSLYDVWKLTLKSCILYMSGQLRTVSRNNGSSSAARRYTPNNLGTGDTSTATNADRHSCNPQDLNSTPSAVTTRVDSPLSVEQSNCPRILFAVQGSRWSLELESISMTTVSCDSRFFRLLRSLHQSHRRAFLRWASPFQFKSCKCVKVGYQSVEF